MINPYSNINWDNVVKIPSCSHEHCENQDQFNKLVGGDVRHIAISNYYPSQPVYPLSSKFTGVPQNAISCPNAEHHNMTVFGISLPNMHINSLGSTFSSGSSRGEVPVGCDREDIKSVILKICDKLLYDDGGGITINHPVWSGLSTVTVERLLDFDPRVLGIEIYNQTSENDNATGWGLKMWDDILTTGRRCWGFAVADHEGQITSDWRGRNILLCPTVSEQECLKAYRSGTFYSKLTDSSLEFTEISFTSSDAGFVYTVSTNSASSVRVIVDGVATTYEADRASMVIPKTATYVRAEAHTENDSIFTNPILLKERSSNSMTEKILFLMS